jgi:hypothetical protein
LLAQDIHLATPYRTCRSSTSISLLRAHPCSLMCWPQHVLTDPVSQYHAFLRWLVSSVRSLIYTSFKTVPIQSVRIHDSHPHRTNARLLETILVSCLARSRPGIAEYKCHRAFSEAIQGGPVCRNFHQSGWVRRNSGLKTEGDSVWEFGR